MNQSAKCSIVCGSVQSLVIVSTLILATPLATAESCPKRVKFPATGQTATYPANKNDGSSGPVAVPDDGQLGAGFTQRFRDNGNGTVTDRVTGLTWEKKGDDGGLHDRDNRYAWSLNPETAEDPNDPSKDSIWDFLDSVNEAAFAGHRDWRIPNLKELQSLVNYGQANPAVGEAFKTPCVVVGIDNVTGSCTVANAYWSSTTDPDTPENAMDVIFDDGDAFSANKHDALFIRAVRGGCK